MWPRSRKVAGAGPRAGISLMMIAALAVGAAAVPGVATASLAGTRSCGWMFVGGTSQLNVLYPDEAARYWVANLPIPLGGHIEVNGEFPHARYTSLTTYTGQLQSIDGLHDSEIVPDPGSSNPFLPHADRTTADRDYTVRIVKAKVPTTGRQPNTLYTTSADGTKTGGLTQRFSLRIYEADKGLGPEGGVPLPDLTLVTADGRRITLPDCPDLTLPDLGLTELIANAGSGDPALLTTGLRGENPPVWHKFTGMASALTGGSDLTGSSSGGFGDNPDNKYVYTYFSQSFGQVLVVRGKAPTFPATYDAQERMGTGQMRYWSFCSNAQTTAAYACRQDDQVPVDAHGYYTVVFSTAAARPRNATEACGIAWLPVGPLEYSILILRNMLPDPAFAHAIQKAQPGTEEQTMGEYYPRGTYHATTADFERLGCDDLALAGESVG